jgi:hypothetical protein
MLPQFSQSGRLYGVPSDASRHTGRNGTKIIEAGGIMANMTNP